MNYSKQGVSRKVSKNTSLGKKLSNNFSVGLGCLLLLACIGVAAIGISAGVGLFRGIIDTVPDIGNINVSPTGFSTFIYNSEGQQTAKLVAKDSNRIPVTMDKIPENMTHAFVSIEDERFYDHNGIDIQGIVRAGYKAILDGRLSQGASTITQQLLKNNVFTGWATEENDIDKIKRKIQEQYLAIELEKNMSKEDILLNYMNTINLGQNTLGVQAASLRYFNKNVYELNLSECATIAAITQNPSKWNPITHPENNKTRRLEVLKKMLKLGYITQQEFDEASNDNVYERIQINNQNVEETSITSYFDDAVTEQVYKDLQEQGYTEAQAYTLLYTGGLSIYSTQDPKIQKIIDDVYSNPDNFPSNTKWQLDYALTLDKADGSQENFSSEMFKSYFKQENKNFNMLFPGTEEAYEAIEKYKNVVLMPGDEVNSESISLTPQPQSCIVVEEQNTGKVVGMIGGRGTKEANLTLNRATSSKRQPGSTFKILSTYAPAIDAAGLTLASVENDAPFNYKTGTPVRNWWGASYKGLQSLRDGIRESENIVTVKCLTRIGPKLGYDYLINFGFTTLVDGLEVNGKIYSDIQQSLALGGITKGVTCLELNAAYAAIANNGEYIEPKLYTKVVDHDGNVLIDNTGNEGRQVIKPQTAYLMTDAMHDVMTSGTGGSANLGNMYTAGKTGTTTDYNDVWMAGYTPYYTASTWVGYDNNTKLSSSAEKNLNKTLWKAVMSKIHEELPYKDFSSPGGIVTATECSKSGKLPIPGVCDGHLKSEKFIEGSVPTESCDVHYVGNVCAYSMLPAQDTCPFQVPGVYELQPMSDRMLYQNGGNTDTAENTGSDAGTGGHKCIHTAEFMANPANAAVVAQQQQEMLNAAAGQAPATDPNAAPAQ